MSYVTFMRGITDHLKMGLNARESAQLSNNVDYWLGDHSYSIKVGYINLFGSITPLFLSVPYFYGYHTMISGTTRAGKTTCGKTVSYCTLEETKKYIEKIIFFDIDNQFREFEKYKAVIRYDMMNMTWTERFNLLIGECQRIMDRDEGEGKKETFFVDEFQNYAPEIGLTNPGLTQKELKLRGRCKETIIETMQQCLKRNMNFIVMTPTITRTAGQAMAMCGSKILFQLENTDAVRKLSQVIPRRFYNKILNFRKGECIIVGKALGGREPTVCKFRQIKKLKTYDMVG